MPEMKTLTLNNSTYDIVDGNAIHIPSTATVGQTIRVSAVDESGRPTEWEAVDLPSGEDYLSADDVADSSAKNCSTRPIW